MSDDNQLGSVDKRKLLQDTPHHEGVWTEIGTAEVKLNIFGQAKVHVIREQDDARRNWLILGSVVLVVALAGYLLRLNESAAPIAIETSPAIDVQPTPSIAPDASAHPTPPATEQAPATQLQVHVTPKVRSTAGVTVPDAAPRTPTPAAVIAKPAPIVTPKPAPAPHYQSPAKPALTPSASDPSGAGQAHTTPTSPLPPVGDITY